MWYPKPPTVLAMCRLDASSDLLTWRCVALLPPIAVINFRSVPDLGVQTPSAFRGHWWVIASNPACLIKVYNSPYHTVSWWNFMIVLTHANWTLARRLGREDCVGNEWNQYGADALECLVCFNYFVHELTQSCIARLECLWRELRVTYMAGDAYMNLILYVCERARVRNLNRTWIKAIVCLRVITAQDGLQQCSIIDFNASFHVTPQSVVYFLCCK